MTISDDDRSALDELDIRLKIVLPEEYHESYNDVQPVSMGSAGLKFAVDGRVAWDQIWGSFCDLAMAGGPPHKGTLLEPAGPAEIAAGPDRYREVVDEICRGVKMVTDLPADPSPHLGWVRVECDMPSMAGWLLRAIVMENVAVRAEAQALDLPAAPGFRLEKEIKNVITVIAKTCHYWQGHMPRLQQRAIANLFTELAAESPLIAPAYRDDGGASGDGGRASGDGGGASGSGGGASDTLAVAAGSGASDTPAFTAASAAIATRIHAETGLTASPHQYFGWLGVECPDVRVAVWMMRALVVTNVLARREGVTLFVPVNPVSDPDGERVSSALARIHRLAAAAEMST